MEAVLFYVFALVVLVPAVLMTFSKNLVRSAFLMIASFLGVAGVYILLLAEFMALVQILVYVGAISVLLVFGVMLTRRGKMSESSLSNNNKVIAALIAAALFIVAVSSVWTTGWAVSKENLPGASLEHITQLLLNEQVIPFEIAGVLLLVAMIGAIIIGKGASKLK